MTAAARRVAWLGLALILIAAAPTRLRAKPRAHLSVSLHIATCATVDARAVRSVLAIELRTSMPGASLGNRDGASRIDVSCQGRLLRIQVRDPITGKTLSRRIDVSRTARRGRDRLVALAAMELLVASWVELETTTRTKVPGVDTNASPTVRRSARAVATRHLPRRHWSETAALFAVAAREDHGIATGGGARWLRDHGRGLGFAVGMLFDTASVDVSLGTVRVRSAQLEASAHVHRTWRNTRWRAAAGARLGLVIMSGEPSDPATTDADTVLGVSVGPMVRLDAERTLRNHLIALASVESGYHVRGVGGLVDDVRAAGVRGPWLTVGLGMGVRW